MSETFRGQSLGNTFTILVLKSHRALESISGAEDDWDDVFVPAEQTPDGNGCVRPIRDGSTAPARAVGRHIHIPL